MDAFIRATVGTQGHPPPTHGCHFCSTVLPSRTRCNSLKTNDGASFYPSQKPEGRIRVRVLPVTVAERFAA